MSRIHRYLLLASVAAVVGVAPAVKAQTTLPPTPTPVESTEPPPSPPGEPAAAGPDIIVTGIRESLRASTELKRRSDRIVDVITAQDIGKLPDENVAESIQRITGVQLTRDGGEGKGVNIRGLTAQTQINNRVVLGNFAEGQSARDFDFRNLAADFIQTIEVSKSPTASLPEGTLGGNINLITRKPLDLREPLVSVGAEALYSDYRDTFDPKLSIFVADQFANGTLGVSLSANFSQRRLRTDSFRTQSGWAPLNLGRNTGFDFNADGITNDVLRPADLRFISARDTRTRYGFDGTIQFRPSSELEVRLDGNYSRFENIHRENFFRTLSTNLNSFNPATIRVSEAGSLLGATYTNQLVEVDGRYEPEPQNTYAFGGNVKWNPGSLTVEADASYARSDRQRTSHFLRFQSNLPATVTYDFLKDDEPPNVVLSTAGGQPFDLLTPSDYVPNLTFDRIINFSQTEYAGRLDAGYAFEGGHVRAVKVGARATWRDVPYRTVQSANQAGNTANPAFFDGTRRRTIAEAPLNGFVGTFPFSDGVLSNFGGSFPRQWVVGIYPENSVKDGSLPFVETLNLRRFGGLLNSVAEQSDITEDTQAAFVQVDFGADIGSLRYDANLGVRYARTKLSSAGLLSVSGTVRPIEFNNTYDNWLPAANLKIEFTNRFSLRLAASKVIERPDLRLLATGFTLDLSSGTARAGNPDLRPYRADQYDISLEYYGGGGSLLSVALFRKDVEDFVSNRTELDVIPGVVRFDGGTEFLITRPVNGGGGRLQGYELSVQQPLTFLPDPLSGLGVIVNYTYTDAETDSGEPFPRLSKHNLNLIGYYERGPFSSRVAYSYRSRFASFGVGGNAAQQSGQSEFNAPAGYLDASASLDVTKKITVVIEGANLLNTADIRYLGTPERVRDIAVNDRRFTAGVRVVF